MAGVKSVEESLGCTNAKEMLAVIILWEAIFGRNRDAFQVSFSVYLLNAALRFFPLVHSIISIPGLLSVVPELVFGKSCHSLKCFMRCFDYEKRRNLIALL